MKKPRIDAFDPQQPQDLGSPMDNFPAIVSPVKSAALPPTSPSALSTPESPVPSSAVQPYARTPVRTDGRRTITRYAFEIYQDQIETFRAFALEDKVRGGKGSMSAMVREALDSYIAKKTSSSS